LKGHFLFENKGQHVYGLRMRLFGFTYETSDDFPHNGSPDITTFLRMAA
jgi:hypothetical protein